MQNRFAQARKDAGLSQTELAGRMDVSKSAVNNWEAGRREPPMEKLALMSAILNVSVDFLLDIDRLVPSAEPLDEASLPAFHRSPVWLKSRGWALVNAPERVLLFADGNSIRFESINEPVYAVPPAFALGLRGVGAPLGIDEITSFDSVWVEPISSDAELAAELRGWYRPHSERLVENEYGNRFYLDVYGAKWLAFGSRTDTTVGNGA
jgi:transcriptional regulator with XRE-family HTH domain